MNDVGGKILSNFTQQLFNDKMTQLYFDSKWLLGLVRNYKCIWNCANVNNVEIKYVIEKEWIEKQWNDNIHK